MLLTLPGCSWNPFDYPARPVNVSCMLKGRMRSTRIKKTLQCLNLANICVHSLSKLDNRRD